MVIDFVHGLQTFGHDLGGSEGGGFRDPPISNVWRDIMG